MSTIDLKLVEKLLEIDYDVDEIEIFKNDFKKIYDLVGFNHEWLIKSEKIPKLKRNRQQIIDFASKYKDMIATFKEKDLLWEMTSGFELNYHWDTAYRNILLDIQEAGKEKILKVIRFLKDNEFRNVNYVNSFHEKYYEHFKKKYNEEKYEIEYYISDGEKIYLAQYYSDSYPVIFKNAKIVLQYRTNNWFSNGKTAYLKTLNVDIENIKYIFDDNKILESIPFDEIKKISRICTQVRDLTKQIDFIETTIKSTKAISNYKDLEESTKLQLKELNNLLEASKKLLENAISEYINSGYDKELFEMSLEHLKTAEWNASIHID